MLELDEAMLEPLALDGMEVPRIRLLRAPPPHTQAKLGDLVYHYERSFPVRGYGANLPRFIREQMQEGKSPLLLERENRLYLYLTE